MTKLQILLITIAVSLSSVLMFSAIELTAKLAIVFSIFSINSIGIIIAGWKSGRQTKTNSQSTQHFLSYYMLRLKQSLQADERQQILDTMVALNLLQGSNLTGVNLSEANLNEADLSDSDLSITKQVAINLNGANLKRANISYSNLSYAILRQANLKYANLHGSSFDHSDLHSANLQKTNLSAASLQDTDLSGANLRGANLRFANLAEANLVGADLTNANLEHCILPDGSEWAPTTDMGQFISEDRATIDAGFFFLQFAHARVKKSE